jgi:hypothetical protein
MPNEISIFRIAAGPSPEEIRQMKLKQRRASELLKLRYTYIYIYIIIIIYNMKIMR